MDKYIKNKLIIFNFFMSVLVILVHSINNETNFQKFVVGNICQYAIPSFFIVSGFLFFVNANSIQIVFNKINKRIKTLLIPYLMWNVIYYFVYLVFKNNFNFSLNELYNAAVNYKYNPVFWYIFQLILIVVITPFMYYVLKNYIYVMIFYLFIFIVILLNLDIPVINEDAIIYFFTGAVLSKLYNDKKIVLISKNYIIKLFSFFIISCIVLYSVSNLSYKYPVLYTTIISMIIINRIVGSIFIFYLLDIFYDYNYISKYMKFNFFLYSTHYFVTRIMIYISNKITYLIHINYYRIIIQDIMFVLTPFVAIYFAYVVSNIMKKYIKNYYYLLTGDR